MIVQEIRESTESCSEAGWYGYQVILEAPVTPKEIRQLGENGHLVYLEGLEKPFFKVEGCGFLIRGFEGEKTVRVGVQTLSPGSFFVSNGSTKTPAR